MIKILTLIMLLVAGTAFAEESPWANKPNSIKPVVYTECKAGFLFIIAASSNGVSIMQVFQDTGDMVPKPQDCECKKDKE